MKHTDASRTRHNVVLLIRDGWGYRKSKKNNLIAAAHTPVDDELRKVFPSTLLEASGAAVGLADGYMGNSEVGHMTIGSGRILFQAIERINHSIADGSFFHNKALCGAITYAQKHHSTLHIIGLLQVEGVHAHVHHLLALLDLCKRKNCKRVVIHVITDGRDAAMKDSLKHVKTLERKLHTLGFGEIVSVSGRYYAMDRDKKWGRTKKAYDAIVLGKSTVTFTDAQKAIRQSHKQKITDEFIIPQVKEGYAGMQPHDAVIFTNFRTDRPRQLTKAIIEKKFNGWKRKPLDVYYAAMTQYYNPMRAHVAFEDQQLTNLLGTIVARAGLRQFRISETEKYAHVTYFFNGQVEKRNKGEDRLMIPSLKVATYDLAPEMRAREITKAVIEQIHRKKYSLIVVNLANADMVGHTGNKKAILSAVETVDECTGRIVAASLAADYVLCVFADHGNAEEKIGKRETSHTTNPVEFTMATTDPRLLSARLKKGKGLKDVAPTVLAVMGLKKPKEMSGTTLIQK